MTDAPHTDPVPLVLEPDGLDVLVGVLRERGFRVVGPTVRDGAIVLDEIRSADALPWGTTATQDAARYRLEPRADGAVFGWAVGPHSWKSELLPSRVRLWRARRDDDGIPIVEPDDAPDRPLALLGVRPCDVHAIAIQDRVLVGGAFVDRDYAARRRGAFVVAVNCGVPGGTCFCTSMGTGPRVDDGYDLALTEIVAGDPRFLVEIGSDEGAEVASRLPTIPARDVDVDAAAAVTDTAAESMGRTVDTADLPALLARSLDHPRYDDVAARCLTCANCTLACPTCFCTSVEDVNDLVGGAAERWRSWDSCFSVDYSYIHGGSVRRSPRARYRQWLTHKFGTWVEQFGTSGCVGCGRCITWCPVGIDVTEELAAIRATHAEVDDADTR